MENKMKECQFCGELFKENQLDYPKKGSPYLSCTSCRTALENESEDEN